MEGQAQDGYLDVLLQLGILGLIPLIVLFLRALRQSISAVERGILNHLLCLAMVLLPLILVGNIGETSFLLPLGIPWFYALLALLALDLSGRSAEGY
jgi:O-antigen ligase